MIRYLLAGAALAAIVTPAQARDHSAYFGIEVGPMFVRDANVNLTSDGDRLFRINYKTGVDGDLIFGYDFGIIRAELETSHKWAKHDSYDVDVEGRETFSGHGHTSGYSEMGNVMADLGKNSTVNFYIGGGAGIAWLKEKSKIDDEVFRVRDRGHFAWQGIAGIRAPVFRYFDVGLKYRYFNAGHFSDNGLRTNYRSHSILASLIYNFSTEPAYVPPPPPTPPPPPPPTPPPATQTGPDGTGIQATDTCPAPPPPPPPPEPTPERGF